LASKLDNEIGFTNNNLYKLIHLYQLLVSLDYKIEVFMIELAGIGKSSRNRLSEVLERNPKVITSTIVSTILSVSKGEANKLLSRWNKSGWLHRIKRGAYVPVPLDSTSSDVILENPFVIAESIYRPGYIGGFSAIKHWDLSEQIIETIYYFSTKQWKKRNVSHGSIKFKIKTIRENKFFGTKTIWYGSTKVMVSDPTKTIIDILDDPKIVGGMFVVDEIFSEYTNSEYYDVELLLSYAKQMGNKTIFKRLGFMLDLMFEEVPEGFDNVKNNISSGYSMFDPSVGGKSIVEKWKLKVPSSWKRKYDRKK
jgi:predicted transcriptional regulator of viral defense system